MQWSTTISSPKLISSPLKWLNKDEMNGIERLHMQLRYSWLNSFVGKNQESTMDENDFEIPIARFLHFLKTKNCVTNFYELARLKEIVSGSEL